MQSLKIFPRTQRFLLATHRLQINNPTDNYNYSSTVFLQLQCSNTSHSQGNNILCTTNCNCNSSLQGTISVRDYSSLPSKQQVERFTYRTLAKSIDLVKDVRSSDGYHSLKRGIWNSYLWSIDAFKKYVLENGTVKYYSQDVKRKIQAAREERNRDK